MGIHKIIISYFCIFILVSCGNTVSQEQYDDLLKEHTELKQAVEDIKASNVQQAVTINQTLEELASISETTMMIRSDVESGKAKLSQAENISLHLSAIKKKLNTLEKDVKDDRYKIMVKNLRTMVKEKEIEISNLKNLILEKDDTINEQQITISQQDSTIGIQQQRLQQMVYRQAGLLKQAGKDFEEMADDAPEDISRKKNRKKINSWTKTMYQTAILYYQESMKYGYESSAADIQRVKYKMNNLKE